MKNQMLYRAVAVAGLAGGALLITVATKAGYACVNPSKFAAMKIGDANGCIEFWFNRYQSLIGNILTAAVAGITLFWIARQLEVSHRESAISAASALRVRVGELEEEIAFLDSLLDQLNQVSALARQDSPTPEQLAEINAASSKLWYMRDETFRFRRANMGDKHDAARVKLREQITLKSSYRVDDKPDLARRYVSKLLDIEHVCRDLAKGLEQEVIGLYTVIRSLEERAIADR